VKTVGIIGGMGPEATVLLMQKLLAAVPARDDADHVPLIVHQNPAVPSRIKRLIGGAGDDPAPVLARMARDLAAAGAMALAMPCNTAHAYAPQIMAATPVPFLDMREASMQRLRRILPPSAMVGLLASPAVRMVGVFDQPFATAGLTAVFLGDDAPLLALIQAVKSGDTGHSVHAEMARLAGMLSTRCDHLLIACTELSLLTSALGGLEWTDTLDCLATSIVTFAKSR
jgi:aspartate racemase